MGCRLPPRYTGKTGVIVTPGKITVKVEGWVSNSRVLSHALPRWSSLVMAGGPDLSAIGRALKRDKLIESILEPSKEIAPQFTAWSIATRDGKVRVVVIVDEGFDSTITLAGAQGKRAVLKRQDIEERTALPTSLMPDNLAEQMTTREFRDLLAYLLERR